MQHWSDAAALPNGSKTENWAIKGADHLSSRVCSEHKAVAVSHRFVLCPSNAHWSAKLWRGRERLALSLSSALDRLCDVSRQRALVRCWLNLSQRSAELRALLWPTREVPVCPKELGPYFSLKNLPNIQTMVFLITPFQNTSETMTTKREFKNYSLQYTFI